ncbi:MAG: DUF3040 domain-containing protein [Actinomycetota bacterium]|nr:DUF3040 domain-containing protein [Actinomycetota bacterium]
MPLSEHEQNILREIEKNFYESDPSFAARVREETVYKHAGRNCKWSALTFIIGLAFTILTFSMSAVLGSVGFAVMLASAIVFERNLRRLGKAGWAELTGSQRGGGTKDISSKLRKRFGSKDA